MAEQNPDKWSLATAFLARHRPGPAPTHCDECCLRYPCDTRELAESHEALLRACESALAYIEDDNPGAALGDAYVNDCCRALRAAIAGARGEPRAGAARE